MVTHAAKAKVAYEKKNRTATVTAVFEGAHILEEDMSNKGSDKYMDTHEADEYVLQSLSLPLTSHLDLLH